MEKEIIEEEIDLIDLIKKILAKKTFIIKTTGVFMILGVLVAIFSAKEYTASSTIVPQDSESSSMSSSLGSLAAMAGINLGNSSGSSSLSPIMYPRIVSSIPFSRELMNNHIKTEDMEQSILLKDYLTKEEYQQFSLISTILKYTIGLPKLLFGNKDEEHKIDNELQNNILILNEDEKIIMDILKTQLSVVLDEKEGYIQIIASMPDAHVAAQVVAKTQELLQKYVTMFKIEHAKANLDFVESRLTDAKEEYETKQKQLASLQDANRNYASASARTTEERLTNEYNIALAVYKELATQKEQINLKVKKDTPVFTVIEPVSIPLERSKPKRAMICIAFTFLGGIIACGLVLVLPFLAKEFEIDKLKSWLPENETANTEI